MPDRFVALSSVLAVLFIVYKKARDTQFNFYIRLVINDSTEYTQT